ncbi:Protein Jade-1 [Taenia solium]|eukprot:TsM_000678200 transcript=TsM_000678200 gene=TsM_000678200
MNRIDDVYDLLSESVKRDVTSGDNGPSECFDRRPISLMLVANNDQLERNKLIKITNVWRPDWLKEGVQVASGKHSFVSASPKPGKLIRCFRDEHYNPDVHHVSKKGIVASPAYNMDDLDQAWVATVNEERARLQQEKIQDWMLEDVLDAAEQICFVKSHLIALTDEGFKNLEYDEDAKCDICQSYNGEDGNELVFCEKCNVCVHQACYGIPNLPDGPWHCRLCEMEVHSSARCALCPNKGGAMKLVESWCHVSCALWVPEVSFQDVDLMEPITNINGIPQARKNLVCVLCKIHYGAPIQCSVKKCKVAFHVTCAFQHNMTMIQELNGYDVRLLGHCPKHSSKEYQSRLAQLRSLKKTAAQQTDVDPTPAAITTNPANSSPSKSDVSPDKSVPTLERTNDPTANFHIHVTRDDVAALLRRWAQQKSSKRSGGTISSDHSYQVPLEIVEQLLSYWRLKRRTNFNKPLIVEAPQRWLTEPLPSPADLSVSSGEVVERCKDVRLSLDRARLICDMVLSREKRKTSLVRTMKSISHVQLDTVVEDPVAACADEVIAKAHIGSSVYDATDYSTSALVENTVVEGNEAKPAGYIMTGNPVVDSLSPDQLVVDPFILARLRASFSRKRGRRRQRPSNEGRVGAEACRQMKVGEFLTSPVRRRGRPRKALTIVQTNSAVQPTTRLQDPNGTDETFDVPYDSLP